MYNTSEQHKAVAEFVSEQWREHLGIEVRLRNAEWKVYLEERRQGSYTIARAAWIGDYLDPHTFFSLWSSTNGNNHSGFNNPTFDALLQASNETPDQAQRLKLFQQMEHLLSVEQAAVMPLYWYVNQGMLAEQVRGFRPNILDIHPFQYLWLEP